jgi:thiol:disulfide interchange protein DsbA
MKFNRRNFLDFTGSSLIATTVGLSPEQSRAQNAHPQEGIEYKRLRLAQTPRQGAPIEVLEFFSYACPHCFAMETVLRPWEHSLPKDAVLRRVPVPFLASADNLMKSYFAFEALGLAERMSPVLFAAINVEHQRLSTPQDVAALVTKNGGDSAKFLETVRSFAVASNVARARKLLDDYSVDSTPTFVVQGNYLTSPAQAGGHAQTLAVLDFLMNRVRSGA